MSWESAILAYSGRKVGCRYPLPHGYEMPTNLAPNTYYPAGQVLGLFATTANDVQTGTVTGGPTGGDVLVTVTHPLSGMTETIAIPYNSTASTAQGLIRGIFGGGANYNVTGGPWPGTPLVFTAAGVFLAMNFNLMRAVSRLVGGTNPSVSFVKTTPGRTKGTRGKYTPGASDGTDTADSICGYDFATDSGGNITLGPSSIEGYSGEVFKSVPVWFGGNFGTNELIGLDAAAVVDLGTLIGPIADGWLKLK